ncbi:hypothetical protein RhiirC2_825633 [Rhizophagus irregularis]|uniref:Uncharacterized protein n=1 Tax=Rhizophagus irregularis TaxID=588596 RepID=A0A2N1M7C6_9GLOM|nr:hypothetical protein RhiirC2_825633 [Rhizophagus irregularis]
MAGYASKRFSGRADEDIDEFIKDYRLYLTAANITTANAGGKQRALELFWSCLTDEASRWAEDKLKGKKWRLNHVRCGNALANMAAIVALNNANITATMINTPDGTLPPGLPAGATGATVIPAHNVHADEDWSLAGGCPVDAGTATNAPNGALNNNNHIVLPDINISQKGGESKKPSSKEISSAKQREIPLEDTIRKVLQSELRLIFPPHFFQDSGLIVSEQIVAPLELKIKSQNDVSSSSKDSDESSLEEESLDDPMEIYFVQKKEPKTSVATVKCKIKRLKIPAMTLESGAEPPIITENIVDRVGAKIDKSKKHDLSGIATVPIESIGIVRNLPLTLAPGLTIYEDFIVVRYHKPTLIFSNQLLKKYGCAVDWNTNELKIPFNGKDYIIPVTMHKVKNKLEVNCVTTTSDCDGSSTPDKVSQDLQDLGEDGSLKKK